MAELPTSETATITLQLDNTDLIRTLSQQGTLTKQEAREVERALTNAYKDAAKAAENAARQTARANSQAARQAERDAQRAARAIERSVGEQTSAIRGLFSAAFGGVGGDLLDLGDALGGVDAGLSGIAVGLTALAVGPVVIGGITAATKELADEALLAEQRLMDEGDAIASLIAPQDQQALEEYEKASADLRTTADLLTVALGAGVAPALTTVTDLLIGIAPEAQVANESMRGLVDLAEGVFETSRQAARVGSLGLIDLAFNYADAATEAAELEGAERRLELQAERTEDEHRAMLEALGLLSDGSDNVGESFERQTQRMRDNTAANREAAAAAEELRVAQAGQAAGAAAALSIDQEIYAERIAQIEAGHELQEQMDEVAAAAEDAQSALLRTGEQIDGLVSGWDVFKAAVGGVVNEMWNLYDTFQPIIANVGQLMAIEQRRHEDAARNIADERSANRRAYHDQVREYEASRDDMTALERQAAESQLALAEQSTRARNASLRSEEQERKRAAREAFERNQDLQRVQAKIEGARMAVTLATSMAAYLGPLAIPTAVGLAAAATDTQLQIINSAQPPRFHFGSRGAFAGGANPVDIPGQSMFSHIERGEAVVSRRAMATPGAQNVIESLEANRPPQMASPSVRIGDAHADMLYIRQNRPYAPVQRGVAMAGTRTIYGR